MSQNKTEARAFTLVELLVVIGIIALLVSVLLPVLGSARKAAAAAKCAASLRQIGQALQLYAIDNHGYAPAWRCGNTSGNSGDPGGGNHNYSYNLYGVNYNSSQADSTNPDGSGTSKDACFWFDFLAKYLTKGHGGSGDTSASAQQATHQSVIWGCPEWQGYPDTANSAGTAGGGAGLNRQYTGYAYNYVPQMGPGWPMTGRSILMYGVNCCDIRSNDNFTSDAWKTNTTGLNSGQKSYWFKLTDFRPADQRAIAGDSFYWKLEAQAWNGVGLPPQQKLFTMAGTAYASNGGTRSPGTMFDLYRHGTYPKLSASGGYFVSFGGKIAYNILYADGHVIKSAERGDAYRAMFGIFPIPANAGGTTAGTLNGVPNTLGD